MAVFKCKMCGGELSIDKEMTVCECDYCGTKQTLPKLDNEKKENLYDRANHFRRNDDFDKAMGIYEQILDEDGNDAEAYWSLVLCHYGIEYVEDPVSHKRLPTINRTQYTSIFDDDNYKLALQYADSEQKLIYEEEAKAINEIQKGILAISQKEEPFDVFICYKETDNNGKRTQDSVLANDLYHQLTNEGFKVFFSRITLEDKLGTAYEPYIFAALNSAKVMVVLGTEREYFNAVWVKNEWSRYLAVVKQSGGRKVLIPAYRDMDPYDLPEEFSHLQAQDMAKLGFMQDLIRGIKKITENTDTTENKKDSDNSDSNITAESLLERMYMFLEDGEWEKAEEYTEKVLDMNPKVAEAYLGKLMLERKCHKKQDLRNQTELLRESKNYQKVIRFADESLLNEIEECERCIESTQEQKRTEREDIKKSIALKIKEINQWYQDEKEHLKENLVDEYAKNINELIEERENKKQQIKTETQQKIDNNNTLIAELKEKLNKSEAKKASLGIFDISEKNKSGQFIKKTSQQISTIIKEGEKLKKKLEKDISEIDRSYEEKISAKDKEREEIMERYIFQSNIALNKERASKIKELQDEWKKHRMIVSTDSNKAGYINQEGKFEIEAQYDNAYNFTINGLARVKIGEEYGYINEDGDMVIEAQYYIAFDFAINGLARVKVGEKFGYINENGDMVIEAQFDSAADFAINGLAWVHTGEKSGYINEEGRMVIDKKLNWSGHYADNGLTWFSKGEKSGYINEDGSVVFDIPFYFAGDYTSNGLAWILLGGKCSYIDEEGKTVIDKQFDGAGNFASNGLAYVKIDEKYGYINERGDMVISVKFDDADEFADNGLALVKIAGKYGYVNERGEMAIPARFDDADDFEDNGLAKVVIDGKTGYINGEGEMVLHKQY